MRPTKERLEEIRSLAFVTNYNSQTGSSPSMIEDLLTEIDALEKERDEYASGCPNESWECQKEYRAVSKERDHLRWALKNAQKALKAECACSGETTWADGSLILCDACDALVSIDRIMQDGQSTQAARKCGLCIDGKPCNMEGCLNELT